jgi:hypothetical protein
MNLQVVVGLNKLGVEFYGFVTNITNDGLWICTQSKIGNFDSIKVCDPKLFCVPGNLLFR